MKEKLKRFFAILSVEMEDLEDGILMLLNSTEERRRRHEITEYVATENEALLKKELHILKMLHLKIKKLSDTEYNDLEAARQAVSLAARAYPGIPEAIPRFVEKKIEKVMKYVED